ncbi:MULTISPECIES: ATP-binding cassette domain-containing protein [unclassified Arthrobacter]|uniref:ATP-binding cassette domain-containing protein n=1 Tax=unclassified Arthrobacter TaxID=235627 RepID=UPI001C85D43E|nr:ATP-binding cassette domain-containing protein [Arthrobacter sp. MAHUQ-56]MBX7445964.1 ATP-binding cassette domain-containing protein [Arthrobacter sp. MAHUQ-56]
MSDKALLRVENLDVTYKLTRGTYKAVENISFSVDPGEALGIVGESGSGKSTIGRAILGLAEPTAGRILFDGKDITRLNRKERQHLSSDVQVVFQDPRSSLNEAKKIRDILTEPLIANRQMSKKASLDRAEELLEHVGLGAQAMDKLPGSFSGGQRQRIAIARALMPSPRLIICDEPVSALDLSVQAQIMNLFRREQRETGVSYVFIAHDLAVVRVLCPRVLVMSAGRAVESGTTDEVYNSPKEDYTKRLLAAEPHPDPAIQRERRKAWNTLTQSGAIMAGA